MKIGTKIKMIDHPYADTIISYFILILGFLFYGF
jgi:hypothetical protein